MTNVAASGAAPTSRFPSPSVWLNIELGISFHQNKPHTAGFKYARRVEEKATKGDKSKKSVEAVSNEEFAIALPAAYHVHEQHNRRISQEGFGTAYVQPQQYQQHQHQHQQYQQHQQPQQTYQPYQPSPVQRSVSYPPVHHERPVSYPPSHEREVSILTSWNEYDEPVSALSPSVMSPRHRRYPSSVVRKPVRQTARQPARQAVHDRPLPPTPAQFRLGEENLPWSTPLWFLQSQEGEARSPSIVAEEPGPPHDDPYRGRELESLQQAMMSIDGMEHGEEEDDVHGLASSWGAGSLGWAVSSNDNAGVTFSSSALPTRSPITYFPPLWEESFTTRDWSRRLSE